MRRVLLVLSILLMASGIMGLILGSSRLADAKKTAPDPTAAGDAAHAKLIEELLALDDVGVPLLVEALNSPREALAEQAKQALLERFDAWRWPATAESSAHFRALAEALGKQTSHFAAEGRATALDLATRMMSWPMDERYLDRREVLACCERALRPASGKTVVAAARPKPPESRPLVAEPLAAVAKSPAPAKPAPKTPKPVAATPPPTPKKTEQLAQPESVAQALAVPGVTAQTPAPQARSNAAVTLASATGSVGAGATNIPATAPLPGPAAAQNVAPPNEFAGIDSWELFQRIVSSAPEMQARLRAELTTRGFSERDLAIGVALAHPEVDVRRQAVESLTGMSGVDPLRWLWQAARDLHPDVRLTALSLLATSRDARMVEQVERAAKDDSDPRIQHLAQQIGSWRTGPR